MSAVVSPTNSPCQTEKLSGVLQHVFSPCNATMQVNHNAVAKLSDCHTHGLCQNGCNYHKSFFTTR